MSAAASRRVLSSLVLDESGAGFADYSVVLGLFAIQLVCGALAVNHRIDDIVRCIHAVFA